MTAPLATYTTPDDSPIDVASEFTPAEIKHIRNLTRRIKYLAGQCADRPGDTNRGDELRAMEWVFTDLLDLVVPSDATIERQSSFRGAGGR